MPAQGRLAIGIARAVKPVGCSWRYCGIDCLRPSPRQVRRDEFDDMHMRYRFPSKRIPARCLAVLALLAASGCAQVETEPPAAVENPVQQVLPEKPQGCASAPRHRERGVASWYGSTHHGRLTASGEPFDMNAMTAAHRTLPFGTRIRVTNDGNGRSVERTVTDRGPFVKGRILDVSQRAARGLEFAEDGVAKIRLEEIVPC